MARKRNTFSATFCFTTLRVASATKQKYIVGLPVRARSYFALWTNRNVLSKLAQAKQLRLNNVIRFKEIRLFEFPDFPDLVCCQD